VLGSLFGKNFCPITGAMHIAACYNKPCVVIAGGVSANSELRKRLNDKNKIGWQVSIPKFSYCTDNAAMIAMTGKFSFDAGIRADQSVIAQARLKW
jgi:N6-L-threonylcarbamoyladenine synthase